MGLPPSESATRSAEKAATKSGVCLEVCLEKIVAELVVLWGPVWPSRLRRDAWSLTVSENADRQISGALKDGTSEWCVLKLAWFGRGRWDYLFWGVFKGSGT